MAKKKLKIKPNLNYFIAGIISPIKDYKIIWQLNHLLNSNFRIFNKFENQFPDFPVYKNTLSNFKILLIENKNINGILFNDLKKFNYIFKIYENYDKTKEIISLTKKLKGISFVGILKKEKLTKKTLKAINLIETN